MATVFGARLVAEDCLACPDVFHHNLDLDWEAYPGELLTRRDRHFWWD